MDPYFDPFRDWNTTTGSDSLDPYDTATPITAYDLVEPVRIERKPPKGWCWYDIFRRWRECIVFFYARTSGARKYRVRTMESPRQRMRRKRKRWLQMLYAT